MPEGLVQVRPVILLDLAVYIVLGECQQDTAPTLSNTLCALRALLSYRSPRLGECQQAWHEY